MRKVSITADGNDGDYITNTFEAGPEKLHCLVRIASSLKHFRHNWNNCKSTYMEEPAPEKLYANVLTPEEIVWMQTKIPYCEYQIHSIINIKVDDKDWFCIEEPKKKTTITVWYFKAKEGDTLIDDEGNTDIEMSLQFTNKEFATEAEAQAFGLNYYPGMEVMKMGVCIRQM